MHLLAQYGNILLPHLIHHYEPESRHQSMQQKHKRNSNTAISLKGYAYSVLGLPGSYPFNIIKKGDQQ